MTNDQNRADRKDLTRRISSVLDGTVLTENAEVVDAIVGSVLRFREDSRPVVGGNDPMAIERLRTLLAEALDGVPVENADDGYIVWPDPASEAVVKAVVTGATFEREVNDNGVPMRRLHVVGQWEMDPMGASSPDTRPHCEVVEGPCPGNDRGVICAVACTEDQAVATRIV